MTVTASMIRSAPMTCRPVSIFPKKKMDNTTAVTGITFSKAETTVGDSVPIA